MKQLTLVTTAALAFWSPLSATDLSLGKVVQCNLGSDCYIQQYVDHDVTSLASDYRCNGLSYDGHKGTDFALISRRQMEAGVNVMAAASGRVIGVRDGMSDVLYQAQDSSAVAGKECGNGVVVEHHQGWTTQYCHLKRNSVTVKRGDTVDQGDVLGQIGLSGKTQFPHLHLTVRKNQKVVDPFRPKGRTSCSAVQPDETLWEINLPYRPGGLLRIGFSEDVPNYQKLKDGAIAGDDVSALSHALVLYGFGYGFRQGDRLYFRIDGPQGKVFEHHTEVKKAQIQAMRAAGLKRKGASWPKGLYKGEVILLRKGKIIERRTRQVTLN